MVGVGRVAAAAAANANMAQLGGRETDYEQLRERQDKTRRQSAALFLATYASPLLLLLPSSSSSFPSLLPLPFGTYLRSRSRRARPFLPFPPLLHQSRGDDTLTVPYCTSRDRLSLQGDLYLP